ncbi:MAG: dihydrolipoyl dehydrogenase, partial [Acidobacteria bacterium]|nr:dihydrolipoyl dehydrogenase [Acidobacteriota bacterium]
MSNEYDVVVIGSGTGGYVAAIRAAQLGLKTAVVERAPVLGGTCLNWGCIPTKALLEHAHALKIAQDWKEWGLTIGQATVGIDMNQVHARKDKIVKGLTGGIELLFKKNKIDWIKGSARLAGKGKVEVTEGQKQTLTARKEIIVATGSTPRSVPGIEIDRKRIITSDEAIHMKEIPKSIVILGSGAVGVEFGSIFRRFGSEVTIIELLPRIVPVEDEAVSAELEKSFKKQGIKLLTGTKVTSARAGATGVDIEAQTPDGKTTKINAEYLLVAIGRGPVTTGLGGEEAGLQMDRGYVRVDKEFKTSVPGISAIGDVITFDKPGHPQLAHLSSAEGIALAERIAGKEYRPINYDQVPGCTYCAPEIGSVGLTEKAAQERGYDVKTGMFKFGVLAR